MTHVLIVLNSNVSNTSPSIIVHSTMCVRISRVNMDNVSKISIEENAYVISVGKATLARRTSMNVNEEIIVRKNIASAKIKSMVIIHVNVNRVLRESSKFD